MLKRVGDGIEVALAVTGVVFDLPRKLEMFITAPVEGIPDTPDVYEELAFVKYSDIDIGFVPPNTVCKCENVTTPVEGIDITVIL